MTDEQIIQEYQEFVNSVNAGGKGEIVQGRFGDILDLINRQKAENEELRSDKIIAETHERAAKDLFVNCTQQLEEANVEIEGLEETRYELACIIDDLREERNRLLQKLQQARAEAIKEFAERLKEEMRLDDDCDYDCINCHYERKEFVPQIDNLVKEMTKGE